MSGSWHVHLAGGQKVAWALDEDIAWVRRSLDDKCRWTSLPLARIVHAAWPSAVSAIPAKALRGKFVVCQADNPPSFYLGTEGFDQVSKRVHLWIARSSEAEEQFRWLGLPVLRVPYCVDPAIFRPLANRMEIRRSLGLADDAFVIGNFHRDSEGADLLKPKLQKGPDIFLGIARSLRGKVPGLTVLLAGPRRHWLLNSLQAEGIPVVFAGEESGAFDDYPRNILSRARLNELYQALDACVISSRWEGGPYSVLEALAAGGQFTRRNSTRCFAGRMPLQFRGCRGRIARKICTIPRIAQTLRVSRREGDCHTQSFCRGACAAERLCGSSEGCARYAGRICLVVSLGQQTSHRKPLCRFEKSGDSHFSACGVGTMPRQPELPVARRSSPACQPNCRASAFLDGRPEKNAIASTNCADRRSRPSCARSVRPSGRRRA